MTFDIDPKRDYVVATYLPWMRQQHETKLEQVREFTANEARQLYMDGLPLLMNHHDGAYDEQTKTTADHCPIGVIHASSVRGTDAKILASIDPLMNKEAMMSTNRVARGQYMGVSLGQQVETRIKASEGYAVFIKRPEEVSLCRKGRRNGSLIELYCPGADTIRRLAETAPDFLEELIDCHGYRQAMIDSGIDDKKSERYIDALADVSRQRIERAIRANVLHPRPPPKHSVSGQMSNNLKDQASEAAEPDAPPASDAALPDAPPATETETPAGGVATPSIPDVSSLKEMTDAALKYKTESVERAKELSQMREQLVKAQEAETKLAKIEQDKKDLIESEFKTAIKSLEQYSAVAKIPREDLSFTVDSAKDMFDSNPQRSLGMIKSALVMAAKASGVERAREKEHAAKLAEGAEALNSRYLDGIQNRFAQLNEQESSFMSGSMPPPSSFDRRFPSVGATDSPPAASTAHLGGVVDRANAAATAEQQSEPKKRSITSMLGGGVEMAPPPLFVRASNDTDKNTFDAASHFADLFQATGVLPSYTQIADGEMVVATDKYKASADGKTQTPIMARKKTRRSPAAVEPANFAPDWDSVLQSAMRDSRFAVRHSGGRMRQTSKPVPDMLLPE